ncbi:hypothetical protein THASP1DRAFT_30889 [Thamnocephalis sphaerospora]|uniref:Uncharacterized protein n=1 Tax=Thamnocephalis sphaerospora TaxID=78915 RepID=A0A4P9XMZ0_9FUNG|nr:hypothetical protein THASP1DRAFT_30889 [Thamnocephalis sphaerospora]|eukprot:RKP07288.1 hypothetical protein THASP1DRAFT_30889 [Thamnocephalis sphaerospora]
MSFWIPVDRNSVLEEGWEKNATYEWGIPMHPQGELNAVDFVLQAQGDMEEMRLRQRSLIIQFFFNIMFAYLCAYNIIISVRILRKQKRVLAAWCCLLQALAGLTYTIGAMSSGMPGGPSCRRALWVAGFGMTLSPICVGITLLQKAYLVHHRNKRLLIVGIVLLLPQPLVLYYVLISPALMVPSAGCLLFYPLQLPWIKLALDAPINIIFSVAFITVVYRQYRLFGTAAWKELVRDGIQTMCIIVLSNIVCMLCIAFEVAGLFSEFFFIYDWVITSALLGRHLSAQRNMRQARRAPLTANVMKDFSKIAAAPLTQQGGTELRETRLEQHTDTQVAN